MRLALSLTAVDSGTVLVLITLLVAPIAAVAFARSGNVWREIGKGPLAMDHPAPPADPLAALEPPSREDEELRVEVRELVVANNERRIRGGSPPLDVEAEIERRLTDLVGSR